MTLHPQLGALRRARAVLLRHAEGLLRRRGHRPEDRAGQRLRQHDQGGRPGADHVRLGRHPAAAQLDRQRHAGQERRRVPAEGPGVDRVPRPTRTSSRIKDLKGKTVGGTPGDAMYATFPALLKANGMQPGRRHGREHGRGQQDRAARRGPGRRDHGLLPRPGPDHRGKHRQAGRPPAVRRLRAEHARHRHRRQRRDAVGQEGHGRQVRAGDAEVVGRGREGPGGRREGDGGARRERAAGGGARQAAQARGTVAAAGHRGSARPQHRGPVERHDRR